VSDDLSDEVVGKYNASNGSPINAAFIPPTVGASFLALSGTTLYVAPYEGNTIATYTASGSTGNLINAAFITGLSCIGGLVISGSVL